MLLLLKLLLLWWVFKLATATMNRAMWQMKRESKYNWPYHLFFLFFSKTSNRFFRIQLQTNNEAVKWLRRKTIRTWQDRIVYCRVSTSLGVCPCGHSKFLGRARPRSPCTWAAIAAFLRRKWQCTPTNPCTPIGIPASGLYSHWLLCTSIWRPGSPCGTATVEPPNDPLQQLAPVYQTFYHLTLLTICKLLSICSSILNAKWIWSLHLIRKWFTHQLRRSSKTTLFDDSSSVSKI